MDNEKKYVLAIDQCVISSKMLFCISEAQIIRGTIIHNQKVYWYIKHFEFNSKKILNDTLPEMKKVLIERFASIKEIVQIAVITLGIRIQQKPISIRHNG